MKMSVQIEMITCPEWRARQPTAEPVFVGRSHRFIFHHTAGHHPEISLPANESRDEAIAYAHAIQDFHMDVNGWNDSGMNFLVCRNGLILQGRWRTVMAIAQGKMVVSAHCPGQNDQIGIEHEHQGTEPMTADQRKASARLMAWCSDRYGLSKVMPVDPHSRYFPTSCPANLAGDIPAIKRLAQQILSQEGDYL